MNLIPLNDMERMAEAVARSGLFGMKTPEQALALMLTAQAEGLHPATVTQDYDIIQGRAARKTHSVMARFQQAGGTVQWHQLTDDVADATFTHPAGGSVRIDWTMARAQQARLTGKDNWRNYPRAMLRARCIAEGIRTVWPAAIGGYLVSEEAIDMPASVMPERDITPPPETKTAALAAALKPVRLDDILFAYEAATTPEEVKAVDQDAAKLSNDADKEMARKRRKLRIADLKKAQEVEFQKEKEEQPAPSALDKYIEQMRAATTNEERDAIIGGGAELSMDDYRQLEAVWLELRK